MNKIEQFRFDVLEKIRQGFDLIDEAAILQDPAEGIGTHILNVLHTALGHHEEEVMGEYYFLPIEGDNQYHLFNSVLTLTEDMPDDKYDILCSAANALNFFLPVGALVFSRPERIIAYKFTSLIPIEATVDEALNIINGNIGLSLHIVDMYEDELMKLMRGDTELEDFLDILPDAYRM